MLEVVAQHTHTLLYGGATRPKLLAAALAAAKKRDRVPFDSKIGPLTNSQGL